MKSGKIILASAAVLVTIGSSLAFKVANKFTAKKVLVQLPGSCPVCHTLYFKTPGGHNAHCFTTNGAQVTGRGPAGAQFTFFTAQKVGSPNICTHPTTKTTIAV